MSLYLEKYKRYQSAMVGEIIKHYADGIPYQTFYDWFTEDNFKDMRKLGFKSWKKKLRPALVRYIIEDVFKENKNTIQSTPNYPPITT